MDVGTLIINAMLILPAAAARGAARDMRSYQAIAVLIAVVCGVAGLAVSYYLGTAAGATIVLLMGFAFLITFFAGRRRA